MTGGVFPGGNARASLKLLEQDQAVDLLEDVFPGGNARASLKHGAALGHGDGIRRLPGRKRPGSFPAAQPADGARSDPDQIRTAFTARGTISLDFGSKTLLTTAPHPPYL